MGGGCPRPGAFRIEHEIILIAGRGFFASEPRQRQQVVLERGVEILDVKAQLLVGEKGRIGGVGVGLRGASGKWLALRASLMTCISFRLLIASLRIHAIASISVDYLPTSPAD